MKLKNRMFFYKKFKVSSRQVSGMQTVSKFQLVTVSNSAPKDTRARRARVSSTCDCNFGSFYVIKMGLKKSCFLAYFI